MGALVWPMIDELWTLPYFSADILHNNVAVIVFSSCATESVIEDASYESSVHSIYVPADFTYVFGSDTFEMVQLE